MSTLRGPALPLRTMPTTPADLTYSHPGLTDPASENWATATHDFRRFERTIVIGHGSAVWTFATAEILRWGIKRRSGFHVAPDVPVSQGADYRITAGWRLLAVHEPVRVVAVVDDDDRCGFAYGTKHGHPVCGEEAFIVHRNAVGTVFLTLRSLTRPAPHGPWRYLFPALLTAQRYFRRRYFQALTT